MPIDTEVGQEMNMKVDRSFATQDPSSQDLETKLNQVWKMLQGKDPQTQVFAQALEQLARREADDHTLARSQLILGVCALDQTNSEEAIERLTSALARFRWLGGTEYQWYTLSAIAQAWYQLDDYDQMHQTLLSAKALTHPGTAEKFAWLDRIGMIR